jgi:two-component system response regulator TctD
MLADVLLVDDDLDGSAALKNTLTKAGYAVVVTTRISEAEQRISQKVFDIILAQTHLKQGSGLELASLLKDIQSDAYLLVLTEHATCEERISALENGADDCINQPYHPKELLLKLSKLLHRKHATHSDFLSTRSFQLNVKSGDLSCPWGKVNLRKKEFLILSLLIQHKNQVVPKEQMIEKIWSLEETPLISTIDVHVRRLRMKIKDQKKEVIKTAYGVGYMFCE